MLSSLNPPIDKNTISAIFKKCDLDQDGYISFKEFIAVVTSTSTTPTPERIKHAFDSFDLTGKGRISLEDLA